MRDTPAKANASPLTVSIRTARQRKSPSGKGEATRERKGKIKSPLNLAKVTHPSVEAMDSDVIQEMANKMIPKFAVDDKVRFEGG
jgi:hypothetical protein